MNRQKVATIEVGIPHLVMGQAGDEMAWISVHESAVGGKLRDLAKEFDTTEEEALGILVKLWLWGLENADINGKIWRADKEDILDAFSLKLVKKFGFEKIIDKLLKTKWLDQLEDGTYSIHDWEVWQDQWYKAKERRERDTKRKRDSRVQKLSNGNDAPDQMEIPGGNPADIPQDGLSPDGEDNTPDSPAPEGAKPVKKKPEKHQYADFVKMTPGEFKKLVDTYGEEFANACVVYLDNYKGSKGKTYKDDYRAILSWVVDRVHEKRPGLMKRSMAANAKQEGDSSNPFAKYVEG